MNGLASQKALRHSNMKSTELEEVLRAVSEHTAKDNKLRALRKERGELESELNALDESETERKISLEQQLIHHLKEKLLLCIKTSGVTWSHSNDKSYSGTINSSEFHVAPAPTHEMATTVWSLLTSSHF